MKRSPNAYALMGTAAGSLFTAAVLEGPRHPAAWWFLVPAAVLVFKISRDLDD